MELKNIISLSLFIVYIVSFTTKLIILSNKNKIKAFVLGNKEKDKTTNLVEHSVRLSSFLWGLLWFVQIFETDFFRRHSIINETVYSDVIGILCIAAGEAIFILAMVHMKNSWRVGIDKRVKSDLITGGVYKYSRNPAFVGLFSMLAGTFLVYPNFISIMIVLLNYILIHMLVKQEEKHLSNLFGMKYEAYKAATPRYILGK